MQQSRSLDMYRRRRRTNNKVPTGWLDYAPVNTWVENTRLVPFKCPLRKSILRHVDEREHFSLTDLADRLGSQGRKIGLIIDLTDTDRYYDYRDVEEMGIAYCKIRIPGQQGVPEQCCQRFFHVVNSFLRDNQHNDKLIGVHCTHGVNRSGYLVVRYLIGMLGLPPNDAIAAFNRARGHPMEKYLEDLQRRQPTTAAPLPLSDEDENDECLARDRPLPYTRPMADASADRRSSATPPDNV